MKYIYIIFLISIILVNKLNGQHQLGVKNFNQNQFDKNKVSKEVYHLIKYNSNWFSISNDTLSYFTDDRNYKGVINYGVKFHSKTNRVFDMIENVSMCFMNVNFTKCKYNSKDSTITIEGNIIKSLDKTLKGNKKQNQVNIFLGEKKDTIKACYLGTIINKINKDNVEVTLNNKEIDELAVLDTFPAFYFKNNVHKKEFGDNYAFKISGKIKRNTLLAFGASGFYSEIFDIGAMVYDSDKNKLKQIQKRGEIDCRSLIVQNRLVADIEKENTASNEISYYSYTEKAENHILKRQYAFAKESYLLLTREYKTIFARDIHNAIRCAVLSRDYEKAFYFGKKLAQKGVKKEYFNSKIFSLLRKNNGWNGFISDYDSLFTESQNKRNITLKERIEQLVEEDQKDYGLESRKEPKVLYETTERVTNKLIELLKKEGYPSEEKIGVYVKNDTVLITSPDYHVLIRHAIQQKPENLTILNELLNKSIEMHEYDSKRSPNNIMPYNSCFHIYKGNLYNSKSCGKNDLAVKKIMFRFNNPNGFIMDYGNFIVSEYNPSNPKEKDDYYNQNFNFIMKLTEDWEFYEK
jgi:hypothetical protein